MGARWQLNPIRFMQLALAVTICFSIVYMWEFISMSSVSEQSWKAWETAREHVLGAQTQPSSLPSSTENPLVTSTPEPLDSRITVLQGFVAGHKFVREYNVATQGPLYILFMSDVDPTFGNYWCPDCQRAKAPIYETFAKAPSNARLVEIRVGSPTYWKDDGNEFRQNQLFYIDYIPTLMRYDGRGNSSSMLVEQYCLDRELLEHVFRITLPTVSERPHSVLTMYDGNDVRQYLEDVYDGSYPVFIFFLSGFHAFNGRLWCPYCDKGDVAIMHYFHTTAPSNAVFIRAVVAPTYLHWKRKDNTFKTALFRARIVSLRGVPYLGRVFKHNTTRKVKLEEFTPEFHERTLLQQFYNASSPSIYTD